MVVDVSLFPRGIFRFVSFRGCILVGWSLGQQKPISRIVNRCIQILVGLVSPSIWTICASQTGKDFPKSSGEHDKQYLKPALSIFLSTVLCLSTHRVVATLKTADIRTCLWNLSHPCIQWGSKCPCLQSFVTVSYNFSFICSWIWLLYLVGGFFTTHLKNMRKSNWKSSLF